MLVDGSSEQAQTNDDQVFAGRSSSFIDWFRSATGTRLNPKIELADLRCRGAGQGIGRSCTILAVKNLTD
jgi:hypothetical protein